MKGRSRTSVDSVHDQGVQNGPRPVQGLNIIVLLWLERYLTRAHFLNGDSGRLRDIISTPVVRESDKMEEPHAAESIH